MISHTSIGPSERSEEFMVSFAARSRFDASTTCVAPLNTPNSTAFVS